jgi:hypothetical protein
LEKELEHLKGQQDALKEQSKSFDESKEGVSELVKLFQNGDASFTLRTTLSSHLKSLIQHIFLFPGGGAFGEEALSPSKRSLTVVFKNGAKEWIRTAPDDPTRLLGLTTEEEEKGLL